MHVLSICKYMYRWVYWWTKINKMAVPGLKKKVSFYFQGSIIGIFCQSFAFLLKEGTAQRWTKRCGSHRIPGKSNFPDSTLTRAGFVLINPKVAPVFCSLPLRELRNWEAGRLCPKGVGPQPGFCSQKIKGFQLSMERELSLNSTMSWKSVPDLPLCSSAGTPWNFQGTSQRSCLPLEHLAPKAAGAFPRVPNCWGQTNSPGGSWHGHPWPNGVSDSIPPRPLHELRKEL